MHEIASRFTQSVITQISDLGNGLINDTFLIDTVSGRFVLQRINRRVFAEPKLIVTNLTELNNYITQQAESDLKLRIPAIVKTISGEAYYQDERGEIWRALQYLENTISFETVEDIKQAEQTGFALGYFHRLASGLSIDRLHDTLPGFHIAPAYLRQYQQVRQKTAIQDSAEVRYCADFIDRLQALPDVLEEAKLRGVLAERVIHGDPKLNNFLFDRNTHRVVSLIDLDTIKPGLVHYDIGDCIRSLCHIESSDDFDTAICEAVLTHYLAETRAFFTEHDYFYLYPAIRLIPFELGLRFFTDYLSGDVYFKVSEPKQNLWRAVAQFRFCESIERHKKSIEKIITKLAPTASKFQVRK